MILHIWLAVNIRSIAKSRGLTFIDEETQGTHINSPPLTNLAGQSRCYLIIVHCIL